MFKINPSMAITHATRSKVQGRNEMDPPLCGSTSMSHNDFGVRCNYVTTGGESNETSDKRTRTSASNWPILSGR